MDGGDGLVSGFDTESKVLGCYGALLVRGVNHVDEAKCTLGGGWVEAGDKGVGTGVGSSTMIWESIEFGGYVSRKLEVVLWRENICEAGSGRGGPGFEGLVVSFKEPVMVQGGEQLEGDAEEAQGRPQGFKDGFRISPDSVYCVVERIVGCGNDGEDGEEDLTGRLFDCALYVKLGSETIDTTDGRGRAAGGGCRQVVDVNIEVTAGVGATGIRIGGVWPVAELAFNTGDTRPGGFAVGCDVLGGDLSWDKA